MTDVIRDYLKAVGGRMPMDAKAKEQVLRELRAHLEEKADDLSRENPALPREDVERRVVREFGDPEELAFAYGGGRAVVRSSKGEVVLRVGRALGRGTKAFLKWTAISLAFLLVLGAAVGYAVYQESKPYIEREYPTELLSHRDDCSGTPCNGLPASKSFGPPEGANEIRARIHVEIPQAGGSARITVTDPSGVAVYDRTFTGGLKAADADDRVTWTPKAGAWKVTTQYAGFSGTVEVDVVSLGLPPGTL